MNKKNRSLYLNFIFPIMCCIIFQAVLFFCVFFSGNIFNGIISNNFSLLTERVNNQKSFLQNEMIRWSNLEDYGNNINNSVKKVLEQEKKSYLDIANDSILNNKIIDETSQKLVNSLRKSSVTGAFMILNGKFDASSSEELIRAGIYIRNNNPSSSSSDNSDLLYEIGPSKTSTKLNIPHDSLWAPGFNFINNISSNKFFNEPFNAYNKFISTKDETFSIENVNSLNYGYWSMPFFLNEYDSKIITYSFPLINDEGYAYGVCGIEINLSYLKNVLASSFNNSDEISFALGIRDLDNHSFTKIESAGSLYTAKFGTDSVLKLKEINNNENNFKIYGKNSNTSAIGSLQKLEIYNSNAPFESTIWSIGGIVENNTIYGFSNRLLVLFVVALIFSALLGLGTVYIVTKISIRPISSLIQNINNSDVGRKISLPRLNITEIDNLSSTIEQMSFNILDANNKFDSLLEMSKIPIGVFEVDSISKQVYCSMGVYKLLDWNKINNTNFISLQDFEFKMAKFNFIENEDDSQLCSIENDGKLKWLKIVTSTFNSSKIGIILDVTKETLATEKIEYERDHDILTGLLNRRAMLAILYENFYNSSSMNISALLMFDIDGLKFINDNYGHGCGDVYIQHCSNVISKHFNDKFIISRLSGDEFLLFTKNFDSISDIRVFINNAWKNMSKETFVLPDGMIISVRISGGISYYPIDSFVLEQLMKFSDFAMYSAKRNNKNQIKEFDINIYKEDSILIEGRQEFNNFIDEKKVKYAFQPIVSCKNGTIEAYEALMRPQSDLLKSPNDVIRIAREQGKLYQIETLTWFSATKKFVELSNLTGNKSKLFINSIPNCVLSANDFESFENEYGDYLHRIVCEVTESEPLNKLFFDIKFGFIEKWNASVAIDDFGSGYNNESSLLVLSPKYVKVDMSIVRNIDKDKNRLEILRNLTNYCKDRNIYVIAEGVETKEELQVLIKENIDFVQGYYIAIPSFELTKCKKHVQDFIIECNNN